MSQAKESEQQGFFKKFQKAIMIFSVVCFSGGSLVGIGGMFASGFKADETAAKTQQTQTVDQQAQLKIQADGYAKVLEREPNNPIALQGFADAKLKMGDLPGAIPPLEKLVQLYPKEENLKALLATVKQQAASNQAKPEAKKTE